MPKIKKIKESAEFLVDSGLLFEINRKILHPLGLAIEVIVEDDGTTKFGSLWDSRGDPEGIIFADGCFESGLKKFKAYMKEQGNTILKSRMEKLGYLVQGKYKG